MKKIVKDKVANSVVRRENNVGKLAEGKILGLIRSRTRPQSGSIFKYIHLKALKGKQIQRTQETSILHITFIY